MTVDLDELERKARNAADPDLECAAKPHKLIYRSAASPQAVLALIARCRAAEAERDWLRTAVLHSGGPGAREPRVKNVTTLTRDRILAMPAGPDLDALIEERILGHGGAGYYGPTKPNGTHLDHHRYDTAAEALAAYRKHWPGGHGRVSGANMTEDDMDLCAWQDGYGPVMVTGYSTDIEWAWQVVEKLRPVMGIKIRLPHEGLVETCFYRDVQADWWMATAETIPHAVCLAALLTTL